MAITGIEIRTEFAKFLEQNLNKELLRFTTAGSVDDGKSTLIGRLLHDSKTVYEDQLASVKKSRINRSSGPIDFSLITDGLRAEREQGITIDVGYRYFATSRRKFIIADTPGHEQYTRNMATGASTADLAVILIDGNKRSAAADAAAHLYLLSAGDINPRRRSEQDGFAGVPRRRVPKTRKGISYPGRTVGHQRGDLYSYQRPCGRQRRRAQRAHAVVHRPLFCLNIWNACQ